MSSRVGRSRCRPSYSSMLFAGSRSCRSGMEGIHGWTASWVWEGVSGDGWLGALSGVGAGGAVACGARGGDRGAVSLAAGVLRLLRQGAGEVRDAARARARSRDGDGGCGGAWLLALVVLPGRGGLRAGGDGRPVGRAPGAAGAVEALARGGGVPGGATPRPPAGLRGGAGARARGGAGGEAAPAYGGAGAGGARVSGRF